MKAHENTEIHSQHSTQINTTTIEAVATQSSEICTSGAAEPSDKDDSDVTGVAILGYN